jgi:hypothetical protein
MSLKQARELAAGEALKAAQAPGTPLSAPNFRKCQCGQWLENHQLGPDGYKCLFDSSTYRPHSVAAHANGLSEAIQSFFDLFLRHLELLRPDAVDRTSFRKTIIMGPRGGIRTKFGPKTTIKARYPTSEKEFSKALGDISATRVRVKAEEVSKSEWVEVAILLKTLGRRYRRTSKIPDEVMEFLVAPPIKRQRNVKKQR